MLYLAFSLQSTIQSNPSDAFRNESFGNVSETLLWYPLPIDIEAAFASAFYMAFGIFWLLFYTVFGFLATFWQLFAGVLHEGAGTRARTGRPGAAWGGRASQGG